MARDCWVKAQEGLGQCLHFFYSWPAGHTFLLFLLFTFLLFIIIFTVSLCFLGNLRIPQANQRFPTLIYSLIFRGPYEKCNAQNTFFLSATGPGYFFTLFTFFTFFTFYTFGKCKHYPRGTSSTSSITANCCSSSPTRSTWVSGPILQPWLDIGTPRPATSSGWTFGLLALDTEAFDYAQVFHHRAEEPSKLPEPPKPFPSIEAVFGADKKWRECTVIHSPQVGRAQENRVFKSPAVVLNFKLQV